MSKAARRLIDEAVADRNELGLALCEAITLTARRMHARFSDQLRQHGHGVAPWKALRLIAAAKGGITQRELADLSGTSAPTMVKIVDELEEKGYLRRAPLPGDRRANLLLIESAGREVVEFCDAEAAAFREAFIGDIDDDDLEVALAFLVRLSTRLSAV